MTLDAETLKAAAPILIALFSLIGLIVTSYFTYRTNTIAKAADTKAETALKSTENIRRTLETTQTMLSQGMGTTTKPELDPKPTRRESADAFAARRRREVRGKE
jgi:hypothetical protein